jgi:fructoselysine-6-P-deglycase FrlB-like protein
MSETEREIASQPEMWRRAGEVAAGPEAGHVLPRHGERVGVFGCGTSWFIAQAYAALREAAGHGETDAWTPTEEIVRRPYDRRLAISRSGTTTEVFASVQTAHGPSTVTGVITGVGDSPLAATAERTLVLDFADERSVVQTRFATTTLALLRASLGQDLGPAIADAERALAEPLPVDPTPFEHFVFLGHGWTVGLAHEAALKLREAAQAYTESYPAMEYRHGPVSVAGPRTLVWVLGTPDTTVASDIARTGATVRTAELDPMAELVLIQRTAVGLADARGLDVDHPKNLTRSVVLTGGRAIPTDGESTDA